MKQFVKLLTKYVVDSIEDKCELTSTNIQFTKDGFEVNLKYKIPDDFYILLDKLDNQLNIGDKVNTIVYYGDIEGIIKEVDYINKKVDVELVSGDIFTVNAKTCKKVLDK